MRIGKSRHALKGDSLARLGRTLAAIVLAIACNYTLSRLGLLHGLERLVLDWEMTAGNRATADIVIVKISDLEYDDFFGGRSPLAWDSFAGSSVRSRGAGPR